MNTLIAIAGIGILSMIADILRYRKVIVPLAIIGLLIASVVTVMDWNTNIRYFSDMMYFDNISIL